MIRRLADLEYRMQLADRRLADLDDRAFTVQQQTRLAAMERLWDTGIAPPPTALYRLYATGCNNAPITSAPFYIGLFQRVSGAWVEVESVGGFTSDSNGYLEFTGLQTWDGNAIAQPYTDTASTFPASSTLLIADGEYSYLVFLGTAVNSSYQGLFRYGGWGFDDQGDLTVDPDPLYVRYMITSGYTCTTTGPWPVPLP
jgi:hypothetical protein